MLVFRGVIFHPISVAAINILVAMNPWFHRDMSHEKTKTRMLSMKYWLFNGDPSGMLYEIIPT